MVFLHVKQSVRHQFLVQCQSAAQTADVCSTVAHTHNARLRLLALLNHVSNKAGGPPTAALSACCVEALNHVTIDAPSRKMVVTAEALDELAAAITTQLGEDSPGEHTDPAAVDPESAGLWIIGRLRSHHEPLSAHVGTNEKTTAVAVLATMTPEASTQQKRIAADPEAESAITLEEGALRSALQAGAVNEEPPPAKRVKLDEPAARQETTQKEVELPPLSDELAAKLSESPYVRSMCKDERLQRVS